MHRLFPARTTFGPFCGGRLEEYGSRGGPADPLAGLPATPLPRRCRPGLLDERVGDRAELRAGERGKAAADGRRVEELVLDVPLRLADPGPVADHGVDVRAGLFVVRHGRILPQTAARIVRSRPGAEKWTRQNLVSRESSAHFWGRES